GSNDRPPMLAPGNYVQWKSRIKRYIDTKPNHELIHYCLTNPPYELGWKEKFVLDSEGNPTTTTEKVFETYKTVTQEIGDLLNTEAEAHQNEVNELRAERLAHTPVVQKSKIQCYNCKEYGHISRECQKPKRANNAAYHKEKILLCKQEEARFQLNADQADWKDDTDDESDDQELEAH
nr:hypothetical protein [Tanacetum cinerariifolium]